MFLTLRYVATAKQGNLTVSEIAWAFLPAWVRANFALFDFVR